MTIVCEKEYEPWGGAKEIWERIVEEGKEQDLENLLAEMEPERKGPVDETYLNDLLWFDWEWVYECLGIKDKESESEEEEK